MCAPVKSPPPGCVANIPLMDQGHPFPGVTTLWSCFSPHQQLRPPLICHRWLGLHFIGSDKWSHTVCALFFLASLAYPAVLRVIRIAMGITRSFLLLLGHIPLSSYARTFSPTHLLMGMWAVSTLGLLQLNLQRFWRRLCRNMCLYKTHVWVKTWNDKSMW